MNEIRIGLSAAIGTWILITAVSLSACDTNEPEGPEADGAAVASFLQSVNYQQTWETWPGMGELYEGTEPHGMLLTTRLNESALEALRNKAGVMPDGAIIVKENHKPDSTLASITTMYKVDGYNPDHNNWFFVKHGADWSVQAEGRVEGCQTCHGEVADNDYLFTGPLD